MNRTALICSDDNACVFTYCACGSMLIDYIARAVDDSISSLFILSDKDVFDGKYSVCERVDELDGYSSVTVIAGCTPLITRSTIQRLVDCVEKLGLKAARVSNAPVFCFAPDVLNEVKDASYGAMENVFASIDKESMTVISDVDADETPTVCNPKDLPKVISILNARKADELMESGVIIIDPDNTYIDSDVRVGANTVIYPDNYLMVGTRIGEGCTLYPGNRIERSVLDSGVIARSSVMIDAHVGEGTTVGPFAYLRPGANIGKKARIGDFVEIKNANIGDGSKCSHLSYVGDADVGAGVNIGCGVVFVNYDGRNKFRSVVGDHAFIGSNSNLVAPVALGDSAFVAAGSTVTNDVPEEALCIARARQVVKEGWVGKKKEENK